jgi:AAA15 family ATPase/GTPase
MEKHNPIFSLKNFRSFNEEGADFELAPITLLTGCNSAGKSSLVKALMLMSMQNNKKGVAPISSLQVSSKELNLGRFDKVLHRNTKTDTICLSYKIWSNYLQEDVLVNRFFRGGKNDMLNNGELKAFTIEKEDGTLIYKFRPNAIDYIYPEFEENDDAIRVIFSVFQKHAVM